MKVIYFLCTQIKKFVWLKYPGKRINVDDNERFIKEDGNFEVEGRSFVKDHGNFEVDGKSFVKDDGNFEVDGKSFVKDGSNFEVDGRNNLRFDKKINKGMRYK